ncbi:MAG: gas vesicle protein K [Verrucomicrobia bacterium]|nr:gas vesicle protein K [Verrucomicrobiota bacterium]
MTSPSQLDHDPRGSQRLLPGEEMPARPPPIAALPLALADQASPLPSDTLAEKTELIASAIADSSRKKNGLGQLVLTLIKVLHELLKRQAIRRIEGGSLTPAQIERLGVTLMQQAEELERLRKDFGLPEEDLNLDLGPLGKLL